MKSSSSFDGRAVLVASDPGVPTAVLVLVAAQPVERALDGQLAGGTRADPLRRGPSGRARASADRSWGSPRDPGRRDAIAERRQSGTAARTPCGSASPEPAESAHVTADRGVQGQRAGKLPPACPRPSLQSRAAVRPGEVSLRLELRAARSGTIRDPARHDSASLASNRSGRIRRSVCEHEVTARDGCSLRSRRPLPVDRATAGAAESAAWSQLGQVRRQWLLGRWILTQSLQVRIGSRLRWRRRGQVLCLLGVASPPRPGQQSLARHSEIGCARSSTLGRGTGSLSVRQRERRRSTRSQRDRASGRHPFGPCARRRSIEVELPTADVRPARPGEQRESVGCATGRPYRGGPGSRSISTAGIVLPYKTRPRWAASESTRQLRSACRGVPA